MFIHLRLHTEFSVVDGTNRIDDVVAAAAADGQPALGITDLNNLFGAIKFYKATRGKGGWCEPGVALVLSSLKPCSTTSAPITGLMPAPRVAL